MQARFATGKNNFLFAFFKSFFKRSFYFLFGLSSAKISLVTLNAKKAMVITIKSYFNIDSLHLNYFFFFASLIMSIIIFFVLSISIYGKLLISRYVSNSLPGLFLGLKVVTDIKKESFFVIFLNSLDTSSWFASLKAAVFFAFLIIFFIYVNL